MGSCRQICPIRPLMAGMILAIAAVLFPCSQAQAGDDIRIKTLIKTDKIDQRLKTDRITKPREKLEDKPVVMLTPATTRRATGVTDNTAAASARATRAAKIRRVVSQ